MSNSLKSIIHGGVSIIAFIIPFILISHSPILDYTIGGVLNAIYHFVLLQKAK